ncbi:ABC transporter substrate-binding protein [Cryobacterium serini]|uniref:Amino acid ABC transporter substrate-binding protein n=1 Tax=Cryobacterium serini TaxID=1259201 RepID=A0A4R9BPU8_9MICO|nr:ABC transporter substrate-binding protein [Cryobacterium serini]TFD87689.1 amino acid ABC transporter substrate-binding protein [Cryobacterium serini]
MSVFAKASASRSVRTLVTGIALIGVSALLLTGCSTGAAPTPTDTETAVAGSDVNEIVAGERDLTLKIGALAPQSGVLAFLGPPQVAGVALAVQDINDLGLGITVEAINADEGDTTTDVATGSVTDLIGQDVTAIVGAAASAVTRTVIDSITGAGIVEVSPSNTGLDFTTYNDGGLYFRTSPSDLLQGEVLGTKIAEDGVSTLGLIVVNDAYGTGLADVITSTFEGTGGKVVATSLFNTGETNFTSQISDVTAEDPDAIAIVTFDQSISIVPALVAGGFPGDKLYFVDGSLKDYSTNFSAGLIAGSQGTAPGLDLATLGEFQSRLLEIDPTLKDYLYAAEAYDAVMLIALAAYAGNDVSGESIASYMQQVSGGSGDGTKVEDFGAAAEALANGEQVDYDGFSGPITLDENGDPTEATIGIYKYAEDNTYSRTN